MAHYDLKTSQLRDYVGVLKAGDTVSLTGTVYTARDAAHKKILAALETGSRYRLTFRIPSYTMRARRQQSQGPGHRLRGPTTSGRMDPFSPTLIEKGQVCMIGKGVRNQKVHDAMQKYGCVYMVAIGGAGAVIADSVKSLEVVAYDELGCESVKRLTVENFPAIVSMDAQGGSLYATGIAQFRTADKD